MKRGLLVKVGELVFAAVLFAVFAGLLFQLIEPIFAGEHPGAVDDFEYVLAELDDLKDGQIVPITSTNVNYTLGFFSPSADKPSRCDRSPCVCVYSSLFNARNKQPLECKKIGGMADSCTDRVRCFAEPFKLVDKPGPQRETIFLCQESNRVIVTKERSECTSRVSVQA